MKKSFRVAQPLLAFTTFLPLGRSSVRLSASDAVSRKMLTVSLGSLRHPLHWLTWLTSDAGSTESLQILAGLSEWAWGFFPELG